MYHYARDATNIPDLICDTCWPDFNDSATRAAIVTSDGVLRLDIDGNIIRDRGTEDGSLLGFDSLSDVMQSTVTEMLHVNIGSNNWLSLRDESGPRPGSVVDGFIDAAIDNATELSALEDADGPVAILNQPIYDGSRRMVLSNRDDWPACRYAKELVDGSRGPTEEVTA